MDYETIINAELSNGKLLFDKKNNALLNEAVKKMSGKVEIVLRYPSKKRSNSQNKYLWGVVYALIADSTGNSIEDVHTALKTMFLGKEASTSRLSTAEFSKYTEKVRAFAMTEYYIDIPDANEVRFN